MVNVAKRGFTSVLVSYPKDYWCPRFHIRTSVTALLWHRVAYTAWGKRGPRKSKNVIRLLSKDDFLMCASVHCSKVKYSITRHPERMVGLGWLGLYLVCLFFDGPVE
jgi:hypothetical protein